MCKFKHPRHHITDTLLQHVLKRTFRLLLGHVKIEPKDHTIQELWLAVLNARVHHHPQESDQERSVPSQNVIRLERVAQEQSIILAVLPSHSLFFTSLLKSHIDHIRGDSDRRFLHLRIHSEDVSEVDMEEMSVVLRFIPRPSPTSSMMLSR